MNDNLLQSIYFNPKDPGSLGGIQRLYQRARELNPKIQKKQVLHWLQKNDTYSLYRPVRYRFPRNRTVVAGINSQWQSDLVDMTKLAKYNDGIRYLITIIDVFSKKSYVLPIQRKTGTEVTQAFRELFKNVHPPEVLQTDRGKEYQNESFQSFLKKHQIHYFVTNNETKCAIVERFNRTLKERLYRWFFYNKSYRYIDVLQDIVESYNRTYHRSIGRAPNEVTPYNQAEVWDRLYKKSLPVRSDVKHEPKVGEHVRISESRRPFKKGYEGGWTLEIFQIVEKVNRKPPVYRLVDYKNEPVLGTFYAFELQVVRKDETSYYPIEKILKEKGKGSKKQYLIRWQGYSKDFDSWVPARDVR